MVDLFEGPQFYIGKVEAIDESTKIIKFSIPSVFDNLGKETNFKECNYPEAKPIGNQLTSINIGDTVFVHKPYGYVNSIFFYQHLDLTSFVGMKTSDKNFIQLIETKNHDKDEILISSMEKITIKSDAGTLTIDGANKTCELKVAKSWTVTMPGNELYSPFCLRKCPVTGADIGLDTIPITQD